MLKRLKRPARACRDALLSRYARTTWLTLLLIAVYAIILRAGLLG